MTIRSLFLVIGFLYMVLGFQNCQLENADNPVTPNHASSPLSLPLTHWNQTPQADQELGARFRQASTLTFPTDPHFARRSRIFFLELNLNTGILKALDARQRWLSHLHYCLSEAQYEVVVNLLEEASMCYPKLEDIEERTGPCLMVYTPPYAVLTSQDSSEAWVLGEKRSSCDIPTDFCHPHASDLQSILDEMKSDLADFECAFEPV